MAEWPLSKSPTSQPDPRGLVITGDRHSMPGNTVMIQRSGIPLLARSEAHQQGALDSASRMNRLWYNQPGYTAVCGEDAADCCERMGWGCTSHL